MGTVSSGRCCVYRWLRRRFLLPSGQAWYGGVHDVKKNFYKIFLYDPFPVESSLLEVLPDHIIAEVVAATVYIYNLKKKNYYNGTLKVELMTGLITYGGNNSNKKTGQ